MRRVSSPTPPSTRSVGARRPGPTDCIPHVPSPRRADDLLEAADGPGAPGSDEARRTVAALGRLRAQLEHTEGVLDDYLARLDAHPDGARCPSGG
jgi:hypothetical protein